MPPPPPHAGSRRACVRGALVGPALGVVFAASGCGGASVSQSPALPHAVPGERIEIDTDAGRLSYYRDAPAAGADAGHAPLLLVHSINAAASAYEVKPLYEYYRATRAVYAPDLPGYGFSERSARRYTPQVMTAALHAVVEEIRAIHGDTPIDALAVSLSSEFLARAASERPARFRSIALVSPTGFDRRAPRYGPPGSHRGKAWVHALISFPLWRQGLFDLLNTRTSARYFLEKTWGGKNIDEGLADYDYLTAHQPGAMHAPFDFLSGYLFSNDITRVHESLEQPVWMSHGVRGDFVDYSYQAQMQGRANWRFHQFQTGALPYFEVTDEFTRLYDDFLAGAGR